MMYFVNPNGVLLAQTNLDSTIDALALSANNALAALVPGTPPISAPLDTADTEIIIDTSGLTVPPKDLMGLRYIPLANGSVLALDGSLYVMTREGSGWQKVNALMPGNSLELVLAPVLSYIPAFTLSNPAGPGLASDAGGTTRPSGPTRMYANGLIAGGTVRTPFGFTVGNPQATTAVPSGVPANATAQVTDRKAFVEVIGYPSVNPITAPIRAVYGGGALVLQDQPTIACACCSQSSTGEGAAFGVPVYY